MMIAGDLNTKWPPSKKEALPRCFNVSHSKRVKDGWRFSKVRREKEDIRRIAINWFPGQRLAWIHDLLWGIMQPGLRAFLNDTFGLYDDSVAVDKIWPNVITSVVSHIVVGVLLSPLEIIRTR